jgi:hypothetical protein
MMQTQTLQKMINELKELQANTGINNIRIAENHAHSMISKQKSDFSGS